MNKLRHKLIFGLLLVLAFYVGFASKAKAYGGRKVEVTKVSAVNGGEINGHIEGFSCIDEAEVTGSADLISTTNSTVCYVLTTKD